MTQPLPPQEPGAFISPEIVNTFIDFLSYGDVVPINQDIQIDYLRSNQNAQRYTGELIAMFDEYGQDRLMYEAQKAVDEMARLTAKLGIEQTPFARSTTWFLWHAAKMRYLANNPVVRAGLDKEKHYDPIDPFSDFKNYIPAEQRVKSIEARMKILYTHLGWELHPKAFVNPDLATRKLDPTTPREVRREIDALVGERPEGDRDSLSSYKLERLGELVYNHLDMRESTVAST